MKIIEQKARAYDEAIDRVRKLKENPQTVEYSSKDVDTICDYIFPELKEEQRVDDETLRKNLIKAFNTVGGKHWGGLEVREILAWLEKQCKSNKSLYIRFGDIPTNGKSKVYNGEIEIGIEEGISVYPAFEDKEGNIILGLNLPITKTSLHTQQHLLEYDNRPCYLVTGDYVGKGTDGEPLIKNVRIIKEIKPYRIKQDKENNTYIINNTPNCGIAVYNEELKDSADERIRKWLIDWAKAVNWSEQFTITKEQVLAWLENQGEQPQGKSALEAVREEKVDNQNCAADKIESKFKVKYAGSEYNVFETKNIAGVPFYGIEDEPNHIDYVQAENCEIISGYATKEKGSSYPTKSAVFSEQKPINKVEPKFHEGDWVIFNENHNSVYQVERIDNYRYYLRHYLGGTLSVHFDNELIRLWTIQDAKDGDVLACNKEILLFKSYSIQGRISLYCWYNGQTNNFWSKEVVDTLLTTRNKIYPATKAQRDTLFKAMADAGYIFDFGKKELKKIEQKPQRIISAEAKEALYGKPAWSEEDTFYV